jgi:hypothetical protein
MYKGIKTIGVQKGMDNHGDGIYELKGKPKKVAKNNMHNTTRSRQKAKTRRLLDKVDLNNLDEEAI